MRHDFVSSTLTPSTVTWTNTSLVQVTQLKDVCLRSLKVVF